MHKTPENLKKWKQAVWEFMLEHCDIQQSGALFIKFHCDDRKNFENRVFARLKGYHRTDVAERQCEVDELRDKHVGKIERREIYLMKKYARRKWGKWYRFVKFLYE
jgi:hypothetical protein